MTGSASGQHVDSDPFELAAWLTMPPTHVRSHYSYWLDQQRCSWLRLVHFD